MKRSKITDLLLKTPFIKGIVRDKRIERFDLDIINFTNSFNEETAHELIIKRRRTILFEKKISIDFYEMLGKGLREIIIKNSDIADLSLLKQLTNGVIGQVANRHKQMEDGLKKIRLACEFEMTPSILTMFLTKNNKPIK